MKATNRKCTYLLLFVTLLICFARPVWADSWAELQQESAKIKSIAAHFSQQKYLHILAKPLLSNGRFYFQAPDSVRWEYTSPLKSVLLMRKGNIKRYTMGADAFALDSGGTIESMRLVLQEISRWSKGEFTKSEYFSATLKEGKEPQIILTPKEKELATMISRIVITLAPEKKGFIQSLKIFENEHNYTIFEFTKVQTNANISERLFLEAE